MVIDTQKIELVKRSDVKPNFDVQIMYDEITKPKQLDLSDTDSSDDELVVQAPQIDDDVERT